MAHRENATTQTGIMLIGGLVEVFLGVNAAGKSLEAITKLLTSTDQASRQPRPHPQLARQSRMGRRG